MPTKLFYDNTYFCIVSFAFTHCHVQVHIDSLSWDITYLRAGEFQENLSLAVVFPTFGFKNWQCIKHSYTVGLVAHQMSTAQICLQLEL